MTPKRRRLWLLLGSLGVLGVAATLVLYSLNDTLIFFYSPSQVAEKKPGPERRFRLGGLVVEGSVQKMGQETRFKITDLKGELPVVYRGLLPDLFREGQGVVTKGVFETPNEFQATQVLAKHDERYMPREVTEQLKKSGEWRPDGQAGTY